MSCIYQVETDAFGTYDVLQNEADGACGCACAGGMEPK